MIKIAITSWGHHCIMSGFGCLNSTFLTRPAHHSSIGCKSTLQNLVPTDNFPAFAIDKFLNSTDEIALQTFFVLQVLSFYQLLTMCTFLPPHLRAFITAD